MSRSSSNRRARRNSKRRHLLEPLEQRRLLAFIEVTTTLDIVDPDDGVISLREAIDLASNNTDDRDDITFASGIGNEFLLTRVSATPENNNVAGDLDIFSGRITFWGNGIDQTIISAGGETGIGERVLHVFGDADVSLLNLTITGGRDTFGGGLLVDGGFNSRLSLNEVSVNDNFSSDRGGGIAALSNLSVHASKVSNNRSTNSGGGIMSFGTSFVTDSMVANNQSLTDSGGGLASSSGSLLVESSTFAGNSAPFGGAILSSNNSTQIRNSTLSGNSSAIRGSAILSFGSGSQQDVVQVINSTITQNQTTVDRAIHVEAQAGGSARFEVGNTLLVGNQSPRDQDNFTAIALGDNSTASVVSLGNNLLDDNGSGFLGDSDLANVDTTTTPVIEANLADNGGNTLTHALVISLNNPAVDAANDALISAEPFDQRGFEFPRRRAMAVDIGAVEADYNPLVVNSLNDDFADLTDSEVTLRDAVTFANQTSGTQVITFDPNLFANGPANIVLAVGEIEVNDDTVITGPGARMLTLDGADRAPIFFANPFGFDTAASLEVSGVTLTNARSSAIRSFDDLTVRSSIIENNNGSGIRFSGERLVVEQSTVSGNSAITGGGLSIGSDGNHEVWIKSSTLSGNQADLYGGAIAHMGKLTIEDSTVTGNTAGTGGGALYSHFNANITVRNSIIAGNALADGTPDEFLEVDGALLAAESSLIGIPGPFTLVDGENNNQLGVLDPGLSPLAFNGGPTPTHALEEDSPAIDTGESRSVSDQRGVPFRRDDGGGVDIGAYERQQVAPPHFVVTTSSDIVDPNDGLTSLREAIDASNGSVGESTITFSEELSEFANLFLDLDFPSATSNGATAFEITSSVAIVGPSNYSVNLIRTANAPSMRFFHVHPGATLTLDDLYLAGGSIVGSNGVFESGGNGIDAGVGFGGAILNQGTTTIINSTLASNQARGGRGASDVSPAGRGGDALGGAIFNDGGILWVKNSTLSGNRATGGVGGYDSSTFQRANRGDAMGGGIHNRNGSVTIENSTIALNHADAGQGSDAGQSIAGAYYQSGMAAELYLANTILSDSNADSDAEIAEGSVTGIERSNIVETNGPIGSEVNTSLIIANNGDPNLDRLFAYNGHQPVHVPLPGSPAINAGELNFDDANLPWDQRGPNARRVVGGRIDIGAIEVQGLDFGDAPPSFPSVLADDGARHPVTSLALGHLVDAEQDGQSSENATEDDGDDGISLISSIVTGSHSKASLEALATTFGRLDAWIDFDGNGTWSENERIIDRARVSPGSNTLSFEVPPNAVAGSVAARFRLSSFGGLAPTGLATDGEVEDYIFQIGDSSSTAKINPISEETTLVVQGDRFVVHDGETELFASGRDNGNLIDLLAPDSDATVAIDLSGGLPDPLGGLVISGGEGENWLRLTGASGQVDFTQNGSIDAMNFHAVDLGDNEHANSIVIDAASIARLAPQTQSLFVKGGGGEPGESDDDRVLFADQDDWRMADPSIIDGRFIRSIENIAGGSAHVQVDLPHAWQNAVSVSDVNNSGDVTALDALAIINELGARIFSDRDTSQLDDPLSVAHWPGAYYDQNGDDKATALDALRVINALAILSANNALESEQMVAPRESNAELKSSTLNQTAQSPSDVELDSTIKRKVASFDTPSRTVKSQVLPQATERTKYELAVDELFTELD